MISENVGEPINFQMKSLYLRLKLAQAVEIMQCIFTGHVLTHIKNIFMLEWFQVM